MNSAAPAAARKRRVSRQSCRPGSRGAGCWRCAAWTAGAAGGGGCAEGVPGESGRLLPLLDE